MPFSCPEGRCYPRFTVVGAVKGRQGRGRFADFERFLHADERRVSVAFVFDDVPNSTLEEKKRRGAIKGSRVFREGSAFGDAFLPIRPGPSDEFPDYGRAESVLFRTLRG